MNPKLKIYAKNYKNFCEVFSSQTLVLSYESKLKEIYLVQIQQLGRWNGLMDDGYVIPQFDGGNDSFDDDNLVSQFDVLRKDIYAINSEID